MGAVAKTLRKFMGLFIEDGSLAIAALIWAAICWWGLPRLGVNPQATAILLAIGLASILAENVLRAAGKAK
ncbi:MAG TPA: hypothetical protein VMG55_22025 [Stellaceae bacterium]|nr:hypothetical protein [Stellaceae bacterium]